MLHPDADALLRAIVANPDDDTARLVYADWLQENGRAEEGEFVRTQCRLAALTPDDSEYPALAERDEELRLWLDAHAPAPQPTFGGGLSVAGGTRLWWHSHRGFPQFLSFEGDGRTEVKAMRALATALGRAFEVLPTRWLVLSFVSLEQLVALLKQPVLAGLTRLTVQLHPGSHEEEDDAARALAGCPHLRNLRGLSLASGFGDGACDALAAAPWGELDWFSSPCHNVTATGFRTLAAAPWFRSLRELSLAREFPGAAFEALCRLPPLPRLHSLALTGDLTAAAWAAFAQSRTFPALAQLACNYSQMVGGRFEALAGASGFTLRALSVVGCGFPSGAAAALAAAPWAPALQVLRLGWNRISPSGLKAVAGCKRFTGLQHLDLSQNLFGPAALAALAANRALSGLRVLKLSDFNGYLGRAPAPDQLARFLARLHLPDLRHLDLSAHRLGGAAARRLADPKFASLRRLVLRQCGLTDAAVAKLLTAPPLQNLIQLDLDGNRLTSAPAALADPSVLPHLAACSLSRNKLPPAAVRKLRKRPGITGV